jgi:hypothetical protein
MNVNDVLQHLRSAVVYDFLRVAGDSALMKTLNQGAADVSGFMGLQRLSAPCVSSR